MAFPGVLPVGVSAANPDPGLLALAKPTAGAPLRRRDVWLAALGQFEGLARLVMLASATLGIYLASSNSEVLSGSVPPAWRTWAYSRILPRRRSFEYHEI
jgi:hypothetical protein